MITTTQSDLDRWFAQHVLDAVDAQRCDNIRKAGKAFAEAILKNTKSCADQTAAIRKVREAVMTANVSIACEPPSDS